MYIYIHTCIYTESVRREAARESAANFSWSICSRASSAAYMHTYTHIWMDVCVFVCVCVCVCVCVLVCVCVYIYIRLYICTEHFFPHSTTTTMRVLYCKYVCTLLQTCYITTNMFLSSYKQTPVCCLGSNTYYLINLNHFN